MVSDDERHWYALSLQGSHLVHANTCDRAADFDHKRNRITSDLRLNSVGCCQELHRFVTTAADHQAKDDAEVTNDTIKAIIGATYLDGGMDAAQKVVRSLGYNMY